MNASRTISRTAPRPSSERGFTMIEVLIAVVVLSIGLLAMSALQIVYIGGSGAAHDSTEATQIADSAVETLRAEGVMWNTRSPTFTGARQPALTAIMGNEGQWVSMYGARAVNYTSIDTSNPGSLVNVGGIIEPWALNAKYCVEAKANWQTQGQILQGEVRVAWPVSGGKGAGSIVDNNGGCVQGLNSILYPGGVPDTRFNVVYIPFVLRQYDI